MQKRKNAFYILLPLLWLFCHAKSVSLALIINTNKKLNLLKQLNIKRNYKEFNNKDLVTYELEVNDREDIVIVGLGFIKVSKKGKFKIHTLKDVLVYKRDSLI